MATHPGMFEKGDEVSFLWIGFAVCFRQACEGSDFLQKE